MDCERGGSAAPSTPRPGRFPELEPQEDERPPSVTVVPANSHVAASGEDRDGGHACAATTRSSRPVSRASRPRCRPRPRAPGCGSPTAVPSTIVAQNAFPCSSAVHTSAFAVRDQTRRPSGAIRSTVQRLWTSSAAAPMESADGAGQVALPAQVAVRVQPDERRSTGSAPRSRCPSRQPYPGSQPPRSARHRTARPPGGSPWTTRRTSMTSIQRVPRRVEAPELERAPGEVSVRHISLREERAVPLPSTSRRGSSRGPALPPARPADRDYRRRHAQAFGVAAAHVCAPCSRRSERAAEPSGIVPHVFCCAASPACTSITRDVRQPTRAAPPGGALATDGAASPRSHLPLAAWWL